MTVKVAINGFGRIGRLILRAIEESGRDDLQVVGINDLGDAEMNAYLLRRDSVHGTFPGQVSIEDGSLVVDGKTIRVTAEPDPTKLPWAELGVDIVMECTGFFASGPKAAAHLEAGAKKVLISAPAKEVDLMVVYGVNHQRLEAGHKIVSNASCTTNCLAPVAMVLHDKVGMLQGFMTTIHAYTGDQRILDTLHKDPRRARAAALSMIPTSTGAAKAVGLVLPELDGKVSSMMSTGRSSRSISTIARPARLSISRRPRWSKGAWCGSSVGTTTSGAFRTAWPIPQWPWRRRASRRPWVDFVASTIWGRSTAGGSWFGSISMCR